jgi:hypothetical protein
MANSKTSTNKTKVEKPKSVRKITNYYKIFFDDNESVNYMKSKLTPKQVAKYLKAYEKSHQKFFNKEFVQFLKKYDKYTQIIDIHDVSY